MRELKAWGASIAVHTAFAALFFAAISSSQEVPKIEVAQRSYKIAVESVFEQFQETLEPKPAAIAAKQEAKNEKPKTESVKTSAAPSTKDTVPAQSEAGQTPTDEVKKPQNIQSTPPPPKKVAYSENEKKQFLVMLRQMISKNIVYPESARRRGLEGEVGVHFTLMPSGDCSNIRVENGNVVFHRAAINAIESVKVTPPNSMPLPMELTLTLSFELNGRS